MMAPWYCAYRLSPRESSDGSKTHKAAGLKAFTEDRDLWRRGSREQFFQNPRHRFHRTLALWLWCGHGWLHQTMNSTEVMASLAQASCWSCHSLGPIQFPRQKSIRLGGILRACSCSSHKLTGVGSLISFVQTRLRTIPMAPFKAKEAKKLKSQHGSEIHFLFSLEN